MVGLFCPQLSMSQRRSNLPGFDFNQRRRPEMNTPVKTMIAPKKDVHWIVSLPKNSNWKTKAMMMSLVLTRDTRPASSILSETVNVIWARTPERPLRTSQPISSQVSGKAIPWPISPASSSKQKWIIEAVNNENIMQVTEYVWITTTDGVFCNLRIQM